MTGAAHFSSVLVPGSPSSARGRPSVVLLALVGLGVFPACRSEKSDVPKTVLAWESGNLNLLDHIQDAVIRMPLYPEMQDRQTLDAMITDGVADEAVPPLSLFPVEPEKVMLHHLVLDPQTATFTARPPGPDAPAALEVAVPANLDLYNVISLRFSTQAGGHTTVQWQCEGDTGYSTSKTLRFRIKHGDPPTTYDAFLEPARFTPLGAGLWNSLRKNVERTVQIPTSQRISTWKGKLKKFRFVPTNGSGKVVIESIILRSSRSIDRFARRHPRETALFLLNSAPVALYGSSAFATKMDIRGTAYDALTVFAPSKVTYAVEVPSGASLGFGFHVIRGMVVRPVTNVRFQIEVRPLDADEEAASQTVFDETGRPGNARGTGGPNYRRLDLASFAGKKVALTFSTKPVTASEPGSRFVAAAPGHWIDPVLSVPEKTSRPNVILFSADTLRPDHLGAYGYKRSTSPQIDRIAKGGITFTEAYTPAPWTLPAHMSMMTGLYPSQHGVNQSLGPAGLPYQLAPHMPTLASVLRENGYYALAITDGGQVGSMYGFCRGFHRYYDNSGGRVKIALQSRDTVQRFVAWLRQERVFPFFAFLHTYQTHAPLQPPRPFDRMFTDPNYTGPLEHVYPGKHEKLMPDVSKPLGQRFRPADLNHLYGLYDGEIRFLDTNIGLLINALTELGLYDNTIFVFTSDHGEEYGERDRLAAHGHTLYNELLKVPLIIRFPAKLAAGNRVAAHANLVDIMPTILDLLDIEAPESVQGKSLLEDVVRAEAAPRTLYAESIRHLEHLPGVKKLEKAVIAGDDKFIDYGDVDPDRRELYDLAADPAERKNLFSKNPKTAGELAKTIRTFRDSAPKEPAHRGTRWAPGHEERIKKLKALGYLK